MSPADLDGDGYKDIAAGGKDCWDDPASIPEGFAAVNGAAQPGAGEVHPHATDTWYDGVDQDCAGDDDFDQDVDAHRSSTHADESGAFGDDCYDALDDAYPSGAASCPRVGDLTPVDVHPGVPDDPYDGTDADCSGNDDFDQDNDGFGSCDECDDTNANVYPSEAPEVWYDGVDANCDGNDGDQDGDGYYVAGYKFAVPADFEPGDCADDPTSGPSTINGFPAVSAAAIHPDASEAWYDDVDQNCAHDDDFDQDLDGQDTHDWPNGRGVTGGDCVDTNAAIYAGAPDPWYDGTDSDCAGDDDYDQDGDGVEADGYGAGGDCDDTDGAVSPLASEDCATTYDDDCDGDTNDLAALGCADFAPDADSDGYGELASAACLCVADATYSVSGVTSATDDCDDGDAAVNPGEAEVCNDGVDNDCDGGAGSCGLSGTVSTADYTWTGESAGDQFGTALGAGDVNGDGSIDVVVGAPGRDAAATDDGAVYEFSTPLSSLSAGAAVQRSVGIGASGAAGTGLAVGDFDGDGYDDTVVGEPKDSCDRSDCGQAWILRGPTWPSTLLGAYPYLWEWSHYSSSSSYGSLATGSTAVTLGDIDSDGDDDVAIGAPDTLGAWGGIVFVRTDVPVTSYLWAGNIWLAESSNNYAGWALGGGQDLDGDGLGDMAVGAPGRATSAGSVYLSYTPASSYVSLSTADLRIDGTAASFLGGAVALIPDVNGDGRGDIVVGARAYSSSTGRAYVFYGGTAATSVGSADATFTGAAAGDYFGGGVCGPGDVDGDGNNDVVIGAYAAGGSGAAYLFAGPISGSYATGDAAALLAPASGTASFGYTLLGPGDLDGDGSDDIVVGALGDDSTGSDVGAAYVFLGGGL